MRKAEQYLRQRLSQARFGSRRADWALSRVWPRFVGSIPKALRAIAVGLLLAVLCGVLSRAGVPAISALALGLALVFAVVVALEFFVRVHNARSQGQAISFLQTARRSLEGVAALPLAVLWVALSPLHETLFALAYSLWFLVESALAKALSLLVSRLEGTEGLRNLLISLGLFLYVLGNLLQFMATY